MGSMSIWDQRVRSHAIWDTQKSLGKLIDQAISREVNDIEITAGIERIRAVLTILGKRLAATDPVLADSITLDSVNSYLVAMCVLLETYYSDGNPAHISEANAKADSALPLFGSFLAPESANDLTAISEAAAYYRQSIESHLASAQEKHDALNKALIDSQSRLATLEAGLTSEVQRLAVVVSDQQTQFSTAQDKRNTDFSTALTEQQRKFSTDQADAARINQDKINTLISDFDQKLKDQHKIFSDQLASEVISHRDEMSGLKSTYEQTAADILEQVQKHRIDVEKLVGVIGNLGVTSGYVTVANSARKMQYLWQFLTLLAMAGLIFVASLVAFPRLADKLFDTPGPTVHFEVSADRTNADRTAKVDLPAVAKTPAVGVSAAVPSSDSSFYQGILTRLFLSITFGVFAAYAARQAALYRESEQRNRRRALELESLGPFIEPLDKDMKDRFRIQIGERSFAVPEVDTRSTKGDDAATILSLLKNKDFVEVFTNFLKTNKP
jgi:predicted  nucleic acid-binding Zn-ribbon protein